MGEFSVKKFDSYILLEFGMNEWVDTATQIANCAQLARDMQVMNKGVPAVVRVGSEITLILDGDNGVSLNPDKIGEILE